MDPVLAVRQESLRLQLGIEPSTGRTRCSAYWRRPAGPTSVSSDTPADRQAENDNGRGLGADHGADDQPGPHGLGSIMAALSTAPGVVLLGFRRLYGHAHSRPTLPREGAEGSGEWGSCA